MTDLVTVIPWIVVLVVFAVMATLCPARPPACQGMAGAEGLGVEGVLDAPAIQADPAEYGLVIHASHLCGLLERNLAAAELNEHVRPGVTALRLLCGPAAILGRVRPVVIDAVYRAAFWPHPHVAQENLEPGQGSIAKPPLVTNVDASPTIAWVVRPLRLMASTSNIDPRSIFRRAVHSMYSSHDQNHPWPVDICQRARSA